MRIIIGTIAAALMALAGGAVLAQHGHGAGHAAPTEDRRDLIAMPAPMVAHTLANMRDHLVALQEINEALARGAHDTAAKVAEARLGMSSLGNHGAAHVAQFMPQAMKNLGTSMHRAASRFALAAQDAGATGDIKPALAALGEVMAACNGCHAAYRFK
jgi:hypothetical protein